MGAVSLAVGAGLAEVKAITTVVGAFSKNKALDERLEQEKVASNLKELQRGRSLERIMSTQVARQGASGFSLSSPTFGAIQKDTLDQFTQDVNADKLNEMFQKTAIKTQKGENIENAALSVGNDFFNAMNSFQSGMVSGRQAPVQSAFSGQMGQAPVDANIDHFRMPTFQTPSLESMIDRGRGRFGLDDPFSPNFNALKGSLL